MIDSEKEAIALAQALKHWRETLDDISVVENERLKGLLERHAAYLVDSIHLVSMYENLDEAQAIAYRWWAQNGS